MKEIFDRIIKKLENEYEILKELYKKTKDISYYYTFQGVKKAIKIVRCESEKYNDGHFGCNTNGEHERCNGCGLMNCKNRNKIWFGAMDNVNDTNAGNNGWIPCSERVPEICGYPVLLTVENKFDQISICKAFTNYMKEGKFLFCTNEKEYCDELTSSKLSDVWKPIAWMPLPEPYKPKFVQKCVNPSSKEEREEFSHE